jgi:serine/threonine-protein kinase
VAAVRAARKGLDLSEFHGYVGPQSGLVLAEVYVLVGDYDAALEQLEHVMSLPLVLSPRVIELDPLWEPLRNDPRLQALLEDEE